jgi:hypothetical protein
LRASAEAGGAGDLATDAPQPIATEPDRA